MPCMAGVDRPGGDMKHEVVLSCHSLRNYGYTRLGLGKCLVFSDIHWREHRCR